MRKKKPDEPRESSIASGWTVESEPIAANETEAQGSANSVGSFSDDIEGTLASATDAVGETDDSADQKPQMSNAALVLLGVFGGLYLLYAWIWLSWAQAYGQVNANMASASGALGGIAQQIVFWLAPLAPIIWFVAAILMNYGRGLRRLVLWIVLGAVVLIPLPVFIGGLF